MERGGLHNTNSSIFIDVGDLTDTKIVELSKENPLEHPLSQISDSSSTRRGVTETDYVKTAASSQGTYIPILHQVPLLLTIPGIRIVPTNTHGCIIVTHGTQFIINNEVNISIRSSSLTFSCECFIITINWFTGGYCKSRNVTSIESIDIICECHIIMSTFSDINTFYGDIPMLTIATSDNLLMFKNATRDISPKLTYAKINPTQYHRITIIEKPT